MTQMIYLKQKKKVVVKKKSYKDTMSDIYAAIDKEIEDNDDYVCYEHEKEEIERKDLYKKLNIN